MSNTNHKSVATINKIKKAIMDLGAIKVNATIFKLTDVENRQFTIHLKSDGSVVFIQGGKILHDFDTSNTSELRELIDIIKGLAKHYRELKEEAEKAAQADMEAAKQQEKENRKMGPATHVNKSKITGALLKNGWSQDTEGILQHPSGMVCKFNEKTVRLHNDSVTVNVPIATTTDGQLVEYLKTVLSGKKPTMKKTTDLVAPVEPKVNVEKAVDMVGAVDPKEKAKADKKAAADKKKADEKPPEPPKKPVNPNDDGSTPIFDSVNAAIGETDKAENTIKGAWQPIATQFGFSVSGLTAALHAEGRWPDKLNNKGEAIAVDGLTCPAGYKSVYDMEREAGTKGVGHMVNTASRMFAKFNPELKQKREEALAKKAAESASNAGAATASEKTVDEILLAMSKLAAKLSPEDLKSWLETDPSVMPIWDEMTNSQQTGDIIDELTELGDLDLS